MNVTNFELSLIVLADHLHQCHQKSYSSTCEDSKDHVLDHCSGAFSGIKPVLIDFVFNRAPMDEH